MADMVIVDVRYNFTDQEINAIHLLPENVLQMMKTQLSYERRRLNNLQPDTESYTKYIQDHAAISGAISVYEFWINQHDEIVQKLAVD